MLLVYILADAVHLLKKDMPALRLRVSLEGRDFKNSPAGYLPLHWKTWNHSQKEFLDNVIIVYETDTTRNANNIGESILKQG